MSDMCATCHGRDMVNAGGFSFDLRKFPKDDVSPLPQFRAQRQEPGDAGLARQANRRGCGRPVGVCAQRRIARQPVGRIPHLPHGLADRAAPPPSPIPPACTQGQEEAQSATMPASRVTFPPFRGFAADELGEAVGRRPAGNGAEIGEARDHVRSLENLAHLADKAGRGSPPACRAALAGRTRSFTS